MMEGVIFGEHPSLSSPSISTPAPSDSNYDEEGQSRSVVCFMMLHIVSARPRHCTHSRADVQDASIYMFKVQTGGETESMVIAIATAMHVRHSYLSLENSLTSGICAECQPPPPHNRESISRALLKCGEFARMPDS